MTYEEIADKNGLPKLYKDRFVLYMRTRWPDTEEMKCADGYATEWAQRFAEGREYEASDGTGKSILRRIVYAQVPA